MMRNNVVVTVGGYKGDEYDGIKNEAILKVLSNWNNNSIVHINIDGKQYTFQGDDLIDAIKRCS